jgi:hypothetical protein
MRRGPIPAKTAEWRRRLRAFERCDETVAEFCDREGVSDASFYHWRRVLSAAATRETAPRVSFLPVEIAPSPTAEGNSDARVEVLWPGGVRLLIPCDAPAAIRTVVAALTDGAGEAPAC